MGFMPMVDFLAGLCAGFGQVIVGQPLDYIKTKMQTAQGKRSVIEIAREIVAEHGLKGFYRGSSSMFLGMGGIIAIEFTIYEFCKRLFRSTLGLGADDRLPIEYVGLSGSAVGLFTSSIYCPMQYTKILLQTQKQSVYSSSAQAVWNILVEKGIRGLYNGYLVTVAKQMPGCMVYYSTYETALLTLSPTRESARAQDYLISGSFAGACYWLYSYPFDNIKTRVQSGQSYRSAVSKILEKKSLYRGFSLVLVRCIPVNACNFLIYQSVQKHLKGMKTFQ